MFITPPSPASLARRFAYSAALLAAIATLAIAGSSWWVISQERAQAERSLLRNDAALQAKTVGANLRSVADRMLELSRIKLLENSLLDGVDRERLLIPYLSGIKSIQGIPIDILFADFQGGEIASNSNVEGTFSPQELAWLKGKIPAGQAASRVQPGKTAEAGEELLAVEFINFSDPTSAEGAVLYKLKLAALGARADVRVVHGQESQQLLQSQSTNAAAVDAPAIYKNLTFGVVTQVKTAASPFNVKLLALYLLLTTGMVLTVLAVGFRLGDRLTRDLRRLEFFARGVSETGFASDRATADGSLEVASLSESINRMLDQLKYEHENLGASEERFRSLFEYSELGMNVRNADSKYVDVNPAFARMLGYTKHELLGIDFNDITHPSYVEPGLVLISTLLTGERDHFQMEKQFIRKDGSAFWADVTVSAVRDDAKQLVAFIGVTQDISARKQAQTQLVEQKQRLAEVIWATDIGTWEWTVPTGETVFNPRWAEIAGYTLDELSPISIDTWARLVHPDDATRSGELLAKCFNRELDTYDCEARIRHKNGEWVWVLDRGRVVEWAADGKPQRMSGTHQDITERKRAEAELARFKNVLDNTLDMIFMFEPESLRFVYVNRGAVQSMGYSREELLGMAPSGIQPLLPEEKFRELIAPLLSGQESLLRFDTVHGRRDTSYFPVSVFLQLIVQSDGSRLFVAVIRDITEQVLARDSVLRANASLEERVQARTLQLEAAKRDMEEFAYSVAHDLRQPFIAIGGFSGLLERSVKDKRARHYIERINAGVQRAAELTDALLALANLSRVKMAVQLVDLSAIAHTVMDALQRDDPERLAIVSIQERLLVQADPAMMQVLIQELLGNAWKFTAKRSHVQISFGQLPVQAGVVGAEPVYVVRDSGDGFDMAHIDKLFRSFQRLQTADDLPGMGVGLANVQRIVARHNGRVWAESALGEGSSFYFTLGPV